ncbi:C40 family peptidase [Actinomadura scrupuli]|uniref:C40 family peptidase n=1 Tax=Actinomadura scrupuli TaxID=559629 RepID=UPI003D991286
MAPLRHRLMPHLLVAAASALPSDLAGRVRQVKGVRAVEIVDAAQALVAGKRVGLLGVEPSSFRGYTPKPTAESDGLWRNISDGDIAISFTMGTDGGVQLGSQVTVGGSQRRTQARVGAYATMGIADVEAVVSHRTAQSLGLPSGNALLISAPKTDLAKLSRQLRGVLPRQARAVTLSPKIEPLRAGAVPESGRGMLPTARGQVLTAEQVQVAIGAAQSKLGMPYVWGGESDAEGGYDCSGILQYAFGRAGVRLPRVAADQARAGWIIPFGKAQPGDLLIWAHDPTAPGRISHIALYLGDGRMLTAPHRGAVVRIQPVYFQNFKGAVRINPRQAAGIAG